MLFLLVPRLLLQGGFPGFIVRKGFVAQSQSAELVTSRHE